MARTKRRGTRSLTLLGWIGFLLGSLPGALRSEPACMVREVTWVKEPGRTQKSVRENGLLVYLNTWVQEPDGSIRELGPGPVPTGASPSAPSVRSVLEESLRQSEAEAEVSVSPSIPTPTPEPPPEPKPEPEPPVATPRSAPNPAPNPGPNPGSPPLDPNRGFVPPSEVRPQPVPNPGPNRKTPYRGMVPTPPAAALQRLARLYVGVPFRRGGKSRKEGVDPLTLIRAYYWDLGVELAPEMRALFQGGKFVLKREVQPGDVVFHHSRGKKDSLPDMVGIALSPTEMIYVSGSKRKVIQVEFDSPYWTERYRGARRFFGTASAVPAGGSPFVPEHLRDLQGQASFYGCGDGFHRKLTASGERFDERKFTAAHVSLPFGTRLEITALDTGEKVEVRVNDRGPFERKGSEWVPHSRRILDLSCGAARALGFLDKGLARIRARVIP